MKKLLLLFTCLCVMQSVCYAYDDILNVEVGETFTVYGESHTHIQTVLWDFDPAVFETVSVSGYSTRGKFRAISPSPSVGSVIQATIYYYRDGTTSSGVNKAVSSWKVYVEDDGSESTVSLSGPTSMEVNEVATFRATTSSPKYKGNFRWESGNPSKVEIISENGNTASLRANSSGGTYIYVTLDNGNSDSMYVTVNEVETPTVSASPESGAYEKGTKIYLTASMSDATIRYTTDGSTPTTSSWKYSSYLTLNESFTLKARAYNSSGVGGEVLTCEYTVKQSENDELSYNIISTADKTVEVVSGPNEYEGDIVIPEKVDIEGVTYTVVRIGDRAFSNCGSLTSITIPNSVTTIGDGAFMYCDSLTSITIPNSVTAIGNYAFCCCSSLTDIAVDKGNPAYSSNDGVLYDKSQKTLICWPAGRAGKAIIPNSVTTIGDYAFSHCYSLTSVTIPNSVTTIGDSAFSSCGSLTSITIPNSVTTIGDCAFCGCSSLTSITIPNSVRSIGIVAFCYCSSLTSITIPNSVTSIGYCAFQSCSSLTSITMPNSVTTIGDYAFQSCSSLTSITIPNSVTSIGEYAFYDCSGLTSITSLAVTPPECGTHVFDGIYKVDCTLYVPAGCKGRYRRARGWKDFKNIEEMSAGIGAIETDDDGATEVFNLSGTKESDSVENLPAGIYIVRKGTTVRKIIIK